MNTCTPEEWYALAKGVYDIIVRDIQDFSEKDLATQYPKLVVMYEFFRLIRGEAFFSSRPSTMVDYQPELYRMEDDIAKQLMPLEKRLDLRDPATGYALDTMKKSFSLDYFN